MGEEVAEDAWRQEEEATRGLFEVHRGKNTEAEDEARVLTMKACTDQGVRRKSK